MGQRWLIPAAIQVEELRQVVSLKQRGRQQEGYHINAATASQDSGLWFPGSNPGLNIVVSWPPNCRPPVY